jgi:hypothetical protein
MLARSQVHPAASCCCPDVVTNRRSGVAAAWTGCMRVHVTPPEVRRDSGPATTSPRCCSTGLQAGVRRQCVRRLGACAATPAGQAGRAQAPQQQQQQQPQQQQHQQEQPPLRARVLIVSSVWPEHGSSAAGVRTRGIIDALVAEGCTLGYMW